MKSAAVFVVFACLFIVHVQGQTKISVRRCLCQGHGVNKVRIQRIEKVEVYPPSASCEKFEVLIVLKNGAGKKCVNPESNFAMNYRKAFEKRNQMQENSAH